MLLFRRIIKTGLLIALMILLSAPAAAPKAQDGTEITGLCRITSTGTRKEWAKALDRNYKTLWGKYDDRRAVISIELPEGTREGGLYLCFSTEPEGLELYGGEDETPFFVRQGEGYPHLYIPFEGRESLRLELWGSKETGFSLSEFFVTSGHEPPAWVQRWEPQLERADLLVLVAHPDDELLWMGGAIPYYSVERKMDVAVAYMTCASALRRSEMLNGLWTAGIRHYPYIGGFKDKRMPDMKANYQKWGGKEKVEEYVVSLYRKLRPQVVLSHDLRGEYGHPAHIMTARAAKTALDSAADSGRFTQSASQYGAWDVPKLYLHLYAENTIDMDWQRPLASLDGATSLDTSRAAFDRHRSQRAKFSVEVEGRHSAARFGLVRSLVGDDEYKNDFFENIR